jgi:hypothetical protein
LKGGLKLRGGIDQHMKALFLHQPAYRQELKRSHIWKGLRDKPVKFHSVGHQMHVCAGIPQLASDIMVAGHHACRLASTGAKHIMRDFSRVPGMDAEAKTCAQLHCHTLRKLRRSMSEISVNTGNASSFQQPDHFFGLLLRVAFSQHLHSAKKSFAGGLSGERLAGFGSEYGSQGAALLKRPDLI